MPNLNEFKNYVGLSVGPVKKFEEGSKYVSTLDLFMNTFSFEIPQSTPDMIMRFNGICFDNGQLKEATVSLFVKGRFIVSQEIEITQEGQHWKHLLLNAVGEINKHIIKEQNRNTTVRNDLFDEDEDHVLSPTEKQQLLESIQSIPMFNFEPFLQSLEKHLKRKGYLTQPQLNALDLIKKKYTPSVSLNPAQKQFLKRMSTLPALSLTEGQRKLITKCFEKACKGYAWTDVERADVSSIMQSYRA
jgi:hypothetical protein